MTVYFIGAGPGDPELLTLKAAKRIAACPVCLYAGSLVPEAVVAGAPLPVVERRRRLAPSTFWLSAFVVAMMLAWR